MIIAMVERQSSKDKQPRDKAAARRTSNPPPGGAKMPARAEKAVKSAADETIPPEKLNAGNDK
jgi:hypothetical protein